MALTLNGTLHWPGLKDLQKLRETRAFTTAPEIRRIPERIADALSDVATQLTEYANLHPAFAPIGNRVLAQWEVGLKRSLLPE